MIACQNGNQNKELGNHQKQSDAPDYKPDPCMMCILGRI
jgi:hypothetical protein